MLNIPPYSVHRTAQMYRVFPPLIFWIKLEKWKCHLEEKKKKCNNIEIFDLFEKILLVTSELKVTMGIYKHSSVFFLFPWN